MRLPPQKARLGDVVWLHQISPQDWFSGASHTKSRGLSDSIHRYWWIEVYRWYEYSTLDTVHTYQREGTGTERVYPPLIQVVSVVLRLDTDRLEADAIE